uniref:transcription factor 25-like n=1 Tax=Solea senegalensis TaxID=28829 RepID=UPI001CD910EC|nr:transcription factor 25-like [Solea senegalensis]
MEKNDNGDPDKPDAKEQETSSKSTSEDRVKKKKKKKKTKGRSENGQAVQDDNIDVLLENLDQPNSLSLQNEDCGGSERRSVLHVEHRNLNPETELKKYFGARAVVGDQRPRHRNRQFHRSTWMTSPKESWPRFSRTDLK